MSHPAPYATLKDMEVWSQSQVAQTITQDHSSAVTEWETLIDAASICIDKFCRRVFYKTGEVTRDYYPSWSPSSDVFTGDIVSVSNVQLVGSDGDSEDADPQPDLIPPLIPYEPNVGIRFNGKVNRYSCPLVKVTGVFGWDEVPDDIHLACLILARRFSTRPGSPTGAGGIGGFLVTMDPDVPRILKEYKIKRTY